MPYFFEVNIRTVKRNQMIDITDHIRKYLTESGVKNGLCTVFVPHTTAAVTINENADPDVQFDMNSFLERLIPQNSGFRHSEGNSDSHIKTSLTGPSISIIVRSGDLYLGTWQGIYFVEFDGPRNRKCAVQFMSE